MPILQMTLKLLTICGCWRPFSSSTSGKRQLYDIYTIFIFLVVHTFTLSQLMDIILTVDNSDDFTENLYVLLAMFISCCKMFTLLMNRNNIYILYDTLGKEPCKPMDLDESKIERTYEGMIQSDILHYTLLLESTVSFISLTSVFTDFPKKQLTFRAWLPYNHSSWTLFSLAYTHQIIGFIVGSLLVVACDGLIFGFFMHTCCQIELLTHRLNRIGYNKDKSLRNCIRHHNHIYGFASMVNETFKWMIFIQFLVSMLVICFSLYQLAKAKPLTSKFVQLIVYITCMLTQIFFYCSYGNEVKVKSLQITDKILEIEWLLLSNSDKKVLLVIMRRAMIPIEFTSAYVVTLNLDSFVSLLKTSYSAYNVLQQTQPSP